VVPEVPIRHKGALVEVNDLTWRPFGRRDPVLTGITLRIEPGSHVLLAGPSGAGKSTLLRALAGVLTTTESGDLNGSVLIDGATPAESSVGLMLQDPADAMVAGRVGRDVAFGPENFGMPRDQIWSRVRSALASVGFPYDEKRPTNALSGGESQRLALAGVLALTPRLVLLDEPTSMLDPSSAAIVREAITTAVRASGATLVMVEHELSAVAAQVDRLVVLDPTGRISADGPVDATLATSADLLVAQGVWVPGVPAPRPLTVNPALCAPAIRRSPGGREAGGTEAGGTVGSGGTVGAGGRVGSGGRTDSRTGDSGGRGRGSQSAGGSDGQVLVTAESVSVTRQPRLSVMSANRSMPSVQALVDVCATVRAGECVAVVGPSGAGKSTLTALLAGVDAPTKGQVLAGPLLAGNGGRSRGRGNANGGNGARLNTNAGAAVSRWTSCHLAERFGWVPQQAEHAVVARTVRDDVLSTSRILGMDDAAAQIRVDGLLGVLGLSGLAGADPHQLSGGEQRRLALAGAIAHGPSVLVLDEPSVGQDRSTWAAVAGVVAAARDAGVGVVLATHDPLLIAMADRRITLSAGRVVETVAASVDRPAVLVDSPASAPSRWAGLASRSGPLSILLASVLLVFGAPFISDLRTAMIAIGVEIALAPVVLGLVRVPWLQLLPGLFAVLSVSFSNWLLSPGREVSTGALAGLRVAFFVLPGLLLASRINPSALGDHLGQRLRLPARPVVAAVAALHRFESLGQQWDQLARVRRIRGLGPGRSPLSRGRYLAALTFGLLIQTLRQAGRMAVAMEARGFSVGTDSTSHGSESRVSARRRTWAEPAPWLRADSLMLALGLVVAGIPLVLSRL
jgi:energy-coupling factor transport system ATP-binding protein